ncbi:MAG: protein translocase subunit SecF [Myxococcales bacterium]|nr:protein translocase subunit SecF [Myxococcota bacterium]MDW8282276.1 protein translocase subunit SecF [Myxococcales bacterium]
MAPKSKFFELIRPDHNFNFVGRARLFLSISAFLVLLSIAMLPINAFVLKGRGHALNFAIDFRGGTEMRVDFTRPVQPMEITGALAAGGIKDAEAVTLPEFKNAFLVRFPAVSPLSPEQAKKAEQTLRTKLGQDVMRRFEFSEGGDKAYVKLSKPVEPQDIAAALREAGVSTNQVQRFGRPEENTYEVILIGLEAEVRKALEAKLGAGVVAAIPQVDSVGAKAGKELRDNGLISLLAAIGFIMLYILVRFDFRYGPGTVIALLHDAIVVMGAFAITYKEFSLTTIAALLTVIGYSMNDTVVVFDRIRENASKLRDKKFPQVVNISVNETLSRTILTAATTFFVTLAMNIWGTGVIRDFGFAMNVGVIVGTYSSIFVASPVLIWLNEKSMAMQKKKA